MDKDQMINEILTKAVLMQGVSFAELQRYIGDVMKGDEVLSTPFPNVHLWANVSQTFVDAMIESQKEDWIEMKSCQSLSYVLDGAVLDWPIAQRTDKKGYKEPHWAPSVIIITPKGRKALEEPP
jgi:hypothetical protein